MARRKAKITDSLGRERAATRNRWGKVRALPSGRYQASYVVDGERHTAPMTFTAREDADAWLSVKRSEIERAEWRPSVKHAPVTFGDYARDYIETRTVKGRPIKPTTRAGYLQLLDTALKPFAAVRLDAINPESVRKWYTAALDTGKATTTGHAYRLLAAVLTQAVKDGRLKTSPATIQGGVKARTGRNVTPPTDAELAIIAATIDPRLSLMVEVAAWGGLRYGELTELRRGDVTIETTPQGTAYAVLAITRAVTFTNGGGFAVGTPKSAAGVRTVALPPTLTEPIRERLATLTSDDALVFPSLKDSTKHLHAGAFHTFWRKARAAAGRADMPFHALRHYGLTRYAQTGATVRELLARAGHNDVTTALRYQHEAGRDAELAARMVDQ